MASKRLAKIAAKRTSRRVYRGNIRKSKRQVTKKFANFAGKVAYKKVISMKRRKRRSYRRMRKRMRY